MSRSGYSEDCDDNWAWIKWRGVVASSIRGKRGQAFLRETIDALDALPEKRLITSSLQDCGGVCTLGSVAVKRTINVEGVDPYDHETLSGIFGIADALVREIEFENDEGGRYNETPEQRWARMRAWCVANIKAPQP